MYFILFYALFTLNAIKIMLCNIAIAFTDNRIFLANRSGGNQKGRQKDYQPTMWNEYFDDKQDVIVDNDRKFRVYFAKRDAENKKALLVLLHGGGYSALTWAHFTVCFQCELY